MNLTSRMTEHFRDAIGVFELSMSTLASPLTVAVELIFMALANNGKILACGNGGSSADAQRFIATLVSRFERERLPLAGIALDADTAILTAVGSDYGFEAVYERQVSALGQPGDVLIAMCVDGNSPNVARAIEAARERDLHVIALTGKGGGSIGESLTEHDVHLCVPDNRAPRIQEVHGLLLHALCDGIDALLLGDTE